MHSTRAATRLTTLNDIHSRLNETEVADVLRPTSVLETCAAVRDCARQGRPLITTGTRHAMGGQQFLSKGLVLDTVGLDRILDFDPVRGLVTVEAGVRWPALLDWLATHPDNHAGWTIRQKQTGADQFSIGGALASNIHGRGLLFAPFVEDVESLVLVDADGRCVEADRTNEPELFALVAGGYGLFGVVVRLRLRLERRQTLQREVRLCRSRHLMAAFDTAIAAGCRFGDFQFAIDPAHDDFLDLGVLSCYRPVAGRAPEAHTQKHLGPSDFADLLLLAHTEPSRAFDVYSAFYLATDGQRYASDTQQTGVYLDGYHLAVDKALGHCGSEMITELYVPRERLADFMARAAGSLRRHRARPVYGTVRLIERDPTSLLAWARQPWACIVLNLHVPHDATGIASAAEAFRALIDDALSFGGSYYLTYHRWATREQLEAAHPRIHAFLAEKDARDPAGRWDSNWHRHLRTLLGDGA